MPSGQVLSKIPRAGGLVVRAQWALDEAKRVLAARPDKAAIATIPSCAVFHTWFLVAVICPPRLRGWLYLRAVGQRLQSLISNDPILFSRSQDLAMRAQP